ncbi:MAG: hypothetical protein JWL62_3254 [Hyphomicrobiales bacterium]|nr:hypothetical protein [Hyphomicrobiales bacterium]
MMVLNGFRIVSLGAATLLAPLMLTAPAQAKGCIKGAIVGGIAGHLVGHGKVGAAAGCVVGHHNASKNDAADQHSRSQQTQQQR